MSVIIRKLHKKIWFKTLQSYVQSLSQAVIGFIKEMFLKF